MEPTRADKVAIRHRRERGIRGMKYFSTMAGPIALACIKAVRLCAFS